VKGFGRKERKVRKERIHHEGHEGHEGFGKFFIPNFVLFVSFVVNKVFERWH